jgi:hypothetical protein
MNNDTARIRHIHHVIALSYILEDSTKVLVTFHLKPRDMSLSRFFFVLVLAKPFSSSLAAPLVEENVQKRQLPVTSALNIVNSAISGLAADATVCQMLEYPIGPTLTKSVVRTSPMLLATCSLQLSK